MTREEIYNSLWSIALREVASRSYRFSADTEDQVKEFIHHGVFSNMTDSDIIDSSKIALAELNIRHICWELCRREHQRQHYHYIESRTFVEARFMICPRYPFC